MKAPKSGSEITRPWLEFMLTEYESKKKPGTKVTVKNFTVSSATKPGESFNAELLRVEVEAAILQGGDGSTSSTPLESREYHLIAKFLTLDPFKNELIKIMGYHIKELTMYAEVVPTLNRFQADKTGEDRFRLDIPEMYYCKCTRSEYVLVIENVKSAGFETNAKENGLDLAQCQWAVDRVARLHALSYAYNKTEDLVARWPCYRFSSDITTLFKPVVSASLDNVIRFLKSRPGSQDMVSKLVAGKASLPVKYQALWDDQSRHKLLCLTHGDFWNSNLMFKYGPVLQDGRRSIEALQMIDWQISQWNNPVMDLHYLIGTSTTRTMRRDHLDDVLRHYHTAFTTATSALGQPVGEEYNYEQFRAEYARVSLVGFLMGMCLIQGTLSRAGERINRPARAVGSFTTCCRPFRGCLTAVKTALARFFVPSLFGQSCGFILESFVRRLLNPIGDELVAGTNDVMNDRLMDLLNEADANGTLDAMGL